METSFKSNDNFRNDLLLSYLSHQDILSNNEVFDRFYDKNLESEIFNLTKKPGVKVETLKAGRAILSYVSDRELSKGVKI